MKCAPALALLFALSATIGFAVPVSADTQTGPHEVFGQSLMTASEVAAYKSRLEACKTDQERLQVQADHKRTA